MKNREIRKTVQRLDRDQKYRAKNNDRREKFSEQEAPAFCKNKKKFISPLTKWSVSTPKRLSAVGRARKQQEMLEQKTKARKAPDEARR